MCICVCLLLSPALGFSLCVSLSLFLSQLFNRGSIHIYIMVLLFKQHCQTFSLTKIAVVIYPISSYGRCTIDLDPIILILGAIR